jgi:putative sterol carrier protein
MDARVDTIIREMGKRLGIASGLNGSVKLDFGDDGSILVDGRSAPNTVSDGAGKEADCTISLSLETFERLVHGQIDPTAAFMQGKLRVAGDFGLAMKLGPLLQRGPG